MAVGLQAVVFAEPPHTPAVLQASGNQSKISGPMPVASSEYVS